MKIFYRSVFVVFVVFRGLVIYAFFLRLYTNIFLLDLIVTGPKTRCTTYDL